MSLVVNDMFVVRICYVYFNFEIMSCWSSNIVSFYKLLISGKILDDEKPVSFYKIEEKNFVVVMVTKV